MFTRKFLNYLTLMNKERNYYIMKKIILFLVVLTITLCEISAFYNIAIFCDEYNSSPDIVYGSEAGLMMNWIKLGLLILLSIFTLLDCLVKRKS